MTTAREQIITAAHAAGWTTDPGYTREDGDKTAGWSGSAPDGKAHLHVEFSSRGGITYAATSDRPRGAFGRIMSGSDRLARVLAYVAEHGEADVTSHRQLPAGHTLDECLHAAVLPDDVDANYLAHTCSPIADDNETFEAARRSGTVQLPTGDYDDPEARP